MKSLLTILLLAGFVAGCASSRLSEEDKKAITAVDILIRDFEEVKALRKSGKPSKDRWDKIEDRVVGELPRYGIHAVKAIPVVVDNRKCDTNATVYWIVRQAIDFNPELTDFRYTPDYTKQKSWISGLEDKTNDIVELKSVFLQWIKDYSEQKHKNRCGSNIHYFYPWGIPAFKDVLSKKDITLINGAVRLIESRGDREISQVLLPYLKRIRKLKGIDLKQLNQTIKTLEDYKTNQSFWKTLPKIETLGVVTKEEIQKINLFVKKMPKRNIFPVISGIHIRKENTNWHAIESQESRYFSPISTRKGLELPDEKGYLEGYSVEERQDGLIVLWEKVKGGYKFSKVISRAKGVVEFATAKQTKEGVIIILGTEGGFGDGGDYSYSHWIGILCGDHPLKKTTLSKLGGNEHYSVDLVERSLDLSKKTVSWQTEESKMIRKGNKYVNTKKKLPEIIKPIVIPSMCAK